MNYTKGEWRLWQPAQHRNKYIFVEVLTPDGETRFLTRDLSKADAHLIAAAPDMYEALKAQHEAIDILFAMLIEQLKTFYPSKSGKPWEAMRQGNEAIAKAEGK